MALIFQLDNTAGSWNILAQLAPPTPVKCTPPIRVTLLTLIQMMYPNGIRESRARGMIAGSIIRVSNDGNHRLFRRLASGRAFRFAGSTCGLWLCDTVEVTLQLRQAPTILSICCFADFMVASGDCWPASILDSSVNTTVSTWFHCEILGLM